MSFQKVLYTPGTRQERARQTFIAQIDFVLRDHVPNEFVRVNPLGLQVSYFRVDQAFEEGRAMIANVAFPRGTDDVPGWSRGWPASCPSSRPTRPGSSASTG